MLPASFLPVTLSLLLISMCCSQQFEGDSCSIGDEPGICKTLRNCSSVYKELLKGNPPQKICGYKDFDPLVCCPTGEIATTTTSSPIPKERSGSETPIVRRVGDMAKAKCEEYAKSTYRLVYPPILTVDVKPIKSSLCAIKTRPLIIGGEKASSMEFPHMAAIGYNVTHEIVWKCGGSLISEKFVLTVAHCLYNVNWGPAQWVLMGTVDYQEISNNVNSKLIKIAEKIKHPQYQRPSEYHDIALLRLETEVTFSTWVRPSCVPYSMPDIGTKNVTVAAGWGLTDPDNESGSNNLMKVKLNFVPHMTCNQSFRGETKILRGIIDEWQLCANGDRKDTCAGDSGGPLMILNPDYDCMYNVVGLTSFGSLCSSVVPGVYTRVYHYLSWIESVVWPN